MKTCMKAAIDLSPLERLNALKNWERGPRSRMAPTIAPMRDLMARLGNPHQAFAAIHVTGTKGKGSVCALVEVALHDAGFRVGRYASPHVDSICERVSVRRKLVREDQLMEVLEQVLDVRDEAALAGTPASSATWFDVFTAAAFVLFAREKLDWVVVEVGLGGRLDSTNVVDGKVCVITNIGLEHTDILGTTHAEIAVEKAGILKPGCSLVTTSLPGTEAGDAIRSVATNVGAEMSVVPPLRGISATNLAIAKAVLDSLGRIGVNAPQGGALLDGAQLNEIDALASKLPGRLERWLLPATRGAIPLLIDGAHVDIALAAVLDEAQAAGFASGPLFCLLAFGRDKQPRRMLNLLRGRARHVLFTHLEGRDCWPPDELVAIGAELGISCGVVGDERSGLDVCTRLAADAGWVLASGSLHLVAPVRSAAQALSARRSR